MLNLLIKLLVICAFLTACANPYYYKHEIELNVVYADHEFIQQEFYKICDQKISYCKQKIYGFYDYRTGTLYCERNDYETCGHELRHATEGRYHNE